MEAGYASRARRFVQHHANCFDRNSWPAHITGSAWVVNPKRDKVLLLHHRKHDKWFQPGGHADGDPDVLRVALREVHEETGLPCDAIKLLQESIFDVDIHTIPASERGPEHQHFDIRFLIEIDDRLHIPGNAESYQARWVHLSDVTSYNNSLSTFRMLDKIRRMRTAA